MFLAFCGVVGLGEVMARDARRGEVTSPGLPYHDAGGETLGGETPPLRMLRTLASDPRWRIREAVAMAQRIRLRPAYDARIISGIDTPVTV